MTNEEILAIQESDKDGCEALNKLVHEKLGLCWHDLGHNQRDGWWCDKCVEKAKQKGTR